MHITRAYWARRESHNDQWAVRAEIASRFITPGSSVLDVGCGPSMRLRSCLPESCRYTPSDLVKWTEEVRQVDLNRGEFPPGSCDVVALLGVVEYLIDPVAVLTRARHAGRNLLASYRHGRFPLWRPRHWLRRNNFSEAKLASTFTAAGWKISALASVPDKTNVRHVVYWTR